MSVEQIAKDIASMKIRGAARIGRAAARALAITAKQSKASKPDELMEDLRRTSELLLSTRPTAVSLSNSIRYVMYRATQAYQSGASVKKLKFMVIKAAKDFRLSSLKAIVTIGVIGSRRIKDGDVILTHCNSSAALSIMVKAKQAGKSFQVIATETRPLYQGRLTAKYLSKHGIPVTLIVDSAVRFVMHEVDKVIVGADVVTANGAVVNKIGTSLIALAAREARVRFFVAAETYKFSPLTVLGELVEIEERPPEEIVPKSFLSKYPSVKVRNPAFDVTPPELIDLIITEKGIIPPQCAILILKEEFGWVLEEKAEWMFKEE
ncbi:MAG: ribose 1,5-bisphosphate isomerase [Candidatus Methanomethylicota archaeon]|uniref:Ribose 1,5-bisphosphate isomerase n=1 Tax=Thermoproteota archaeon TaxID=2056631 RepID=A0A497EUU0_9CREN|nr:MAG: ribose 1,5-bisphosphate isomerase [Candidatus Verstraetearchaeota archaeon]